MNCATVSSSRGATEGRTTSGGKCMRPGPITRNGYLNFLREYRQKHCGLTVVETVRQGAAEWNKLSEEEKNKYTRMGRSIDGSGGGTTSGGKCMRPGPITPNGYLNYLREYRQKHCGLTAVETVRQGAAEWNKLSEEEKNKYTRMGCYIGRGSYRQRSRSRSRSGRSALANRSRSGGKTRRRRSRSGPGHKSRSRSSSRRSAGAPRIISRRSRRAPRKSASAPRASSLKPRRRSRSRRSTSVARSRSRSRRSTSAHRNRSSSRRSASAGHSHYTTRRGAVCKI